MVTQIHHFQAFMVEYGFPTATIGQNRPRLASDCQRVTLRYQQMRIVRTRHPPDGDRRPGIPAWQREDGMGRSGDSRLSMSTTDNLSMPTASSRRVNPRLHPARSHPRYYGLVALRDALSDATHRHLRPRVTTARALTAVDLGCGTLPYRPLFADVVDRYIGADLSTNPHADVHLDPQTGHVDLPDASVDVVISTQVLEHVESPVDYLHEARRLVKPHGLLLLRTHGYWNTIPTPPTTGDGRAREYVS